MVEETHEQESWVTCPGQCVLCGLCVSELNCADPRDAACPSLGSLSNWLVPSRRAKSLELGEDGLAGKGRKDVRWGRALTYSTSGAGAEGLTDKQGCQRRLEEGCRLLHTRHPARVGGLQRQSWNEWLPPRRLPHPLSQASLT